MARIAFALCALFFATNFAFGAEKTSHAVSIFGEFKYPEGFAHFDYANPDAPKGGTARLSDLGGFDNLNPYILKGQPAPGLGLVYETLFAQAGDDPTSTYGLIAESITIPDDQSYVIVTLRPEARWQDGKPITAEDVVFSFEILTTKGHPQYRLLFADVAKAEALGPRKVKFTFSRADNRELPIVVSDHLPIFPKHYWTTRKFDATTLEPPLSSGPYKIVKVEANRSIAYERVKDYWGANVPANRGQNNFDRIEYTSFLDNEVALQAFFADVYDFRNERSAKTWATRYNNVPAVQKKRILREKVPLKMHESMQGFVFNQRRSQFADPRVRLAFDYAFDFAWTNKNLSTGENVRVESYFQSTEYAATGLPSPEELALLEPYRKQLPAALFNKVYEAPKTDGSGDARSNLTAARKLLADAGWIVKNGVLVNQKTSEPFRAQFLFFDQRWEDIVQAYKTNLDKLGIQTSIRIVDSAQYVDRLRNFNFDMVVVKFRPVLWPGNEQADNWGSKAAGQPGSDNIAGVKDPVVDAMIERIIRAKTHEELIIASRALDRVLLSGHHVVSQWYRPYDVIAYWDRYGHPKNFPHSTTGFPETWWYDPAKATRIAKGKN